MAYNETLADRIRAIVGDSPGLSERKMFGGIAFMLNGNMCAGVSGDRLMLRLDEARHTAAMKEKHTSPMVFGKGMVAKGLVLVAPPGVKTKSQLDGWLSRAVAFAESLPPKSKKKGAPKKGVPTKTTKTRRR